jgi:cysteine desulfurase / selenocysteine lyase
MIYFNNAATGYPKPDVVIEAVAENIKLPPSNPYRENVTQTSTTAVCRERIAALFQFPHPERVILCSGATEALNIAINGLIQKGARVITTQLEHNAVLRPLYKLRDSGHIKLDILPCRPPGRIAIDRFKSAMGTETRLLVINHASNVTGSVLDIHEIYGVCEARGIPLIVDVSQSAGTTKIDFSRMPKAILAFTGHKSLLGPRGTGGLLVGKELDPTPWKFGGTGIRSELETMPEMWPLKYEPGTMNQPGIAGLAAALDYLLQRGIEYFAEKRRELAAHLCQKLKKMEGISIYAEKPEKNYCGVVSFTVEGVPTEDVGYILQESFNIRVRTGLHCAPLIHKALGTFPDGTARVSFSAFNTHEEIDEFMGGLDTLKRMQLESA